MTGQIYALATFTLWERVPKCPLEGRVGGLSHFVCVSEQKYSNTLNSIKSNIKEHQHILNKFYDTRKSTLKQSPMTVFGRNMFF
jgi:hypothetical protein